MQFGVKHTLGSIQLEEFIASLYFYVEIVTIQRIGFVFFYKAMLEGGGRVAKSYFVDLPHFNLFDFGL